MIRREDALAYHTAGRPGKIEIRATVSCLTPREMRLAYLPGASFPASEIAADPAALYRYTARGNLVALVTNGTAVPGLGDVGPSAAKPMLEGMAVILKRLADIDVFDLEIDEDDPAALVETIARLEPTFGAVNLKDIRAPQGLMLLDRLTERLRIPVFHENLHGTAVVAAAALVNALDLVNKKIGEVRVVLCGAGTVGLGCARLLTALGVATDNLLIYDAGGLLHEDRRDLHEYQRAFQKRDGPRFLADGVAGADVFLGASAAGVLTPEMVRSMGRFPIVLALATPRPEIEYEAAKGSRRDVLVATALDEHPNAVVDLLSVPYILRGALDVQATRITTGMLLAAVSALADLAREEVPEEVERAYGDARFTFGPDYFLPKPIDPRILTREAVAVARCAVSEGIALKPLEPASYHASLEARLGTGREMLRGLILRAKQKKMRVVLSDGANETILRACRILLDEGIASPILLGSEPEVRGALDRLRLELPGVTVVDPDRSPRRAAYVEEYVKLHRRKGAMRPTVEARLRHRDVFAAMMVHASDADMMIAGISAHYAESLRTILDVIGPAPDVGRISSHYLALLPKRAVLLADCAVNIDPSEEELAEIAVLAARTARSLGIVPKVAMLSFSNFGSVDHPFTRKVRRATELAKHRDPGLVVDGEMQLAAALDASIRKEHFPWCELDGDANVLVFPDLQSGNLALHLLQYVGSAVIVGPMLMGARLPAHVLQYGLSAEDVAHLVTAAVVEAPGAGVLGALRLAEVGGPDEGRATAPLSRTGSRGTESRPAP
jgi:malate dehydrogenase (oxaloacetate-decarboxylating)(NADP+)